jgi:hypothetical protein
MSVEAIIYQFKDAAPEEIQRKINMSLSLGIPRENTATKNRSSMICPSRPRKRAEPEPSLLSADEEFKIKISRTSQYEQRTTSFQNHYE